MQQSRAVIAMIICSRFLRFEAASAPSGSHPLEVYFRVLTPGLSPMHSTPATVIVAALLSPCAARLAESHTLSGPVLVDEFDAG
jgi:hypothetical protein